MADTQTDTNFAPDAVLKHIRNLKVGMITTEYGAVLYIEPHGLGHYFNVTWDHTGKHGEHPVVLSHPANLLVTVLCNQQEVTRIRKWIVEYTPGPPAIGVLTTEVVKAESADEAHQIIKDRHRWVMIHKVRKEE